MADDMLTMLAQEVRELRGKVDLPSWRKPEAIIAAGAFLLSIATSVASLLTYRQTAAHERQTELSSVVASLAEVPLKQLEFESSHPTMAVRMRDNFMIQNNMLASHGLALARVLRTSAPASELISVGVALQNANNPPAAIEVFKYAVAAADNASDKLGALHYLGNAIIYNGASMKEKLAGDAYYQQALDIDKEYSFYDDNPAAKALENMHTQTSWAYAWSLQNCGLAKPHLAEAKRLLPDSGVGPLTEQNRAAIAALDPQLTACANDDHIRGFAPSAPVALPASSTPTSTPAQ